MVSPRDGGGISSKVKVARAPRRRSELADKPRPIGAFFPLFRDFFVLLSAGGVSLQPTRGERNSMVLIAFAGAHAKR